MSLELAIQANTAALHQLIAVMSAGNRVSFDLDTPKTRGEVGKAGEESTPLNAEEMKTVATVAQVAAQVIPAEEVKAAVPVTEHVTQYDKPLTYTDDVLPVLHKFLVAKGKPAAESLLKKYAVDKFSKVPVDQLEDLLRDILKEMGVA